MEHGFIATAKDAEGNVYTVDHGKLRLKAVERDYKKGKILSPDGQPLTLVKAYPKDSYHICQYCKGIAAGKDEDILCKECRELFGHSFYSEL